MRITLILSLAFAACWPETASAQLSVYSELLWSTSEDSDTVTLTAFGAASDDSPEGCTGTVTVDVYLFRGESDLLSSWANSDWCGATTSTVHQMSIDEFTPESEDLFSARATASGPGGQYHGCAVHEELFRLFAARFSLRAYIGDKIMYTKYNCEGGCQPERRCIPVIPSAPPFMTQRGLYVRPPGFPIGTCTFVTLHLGPQVCSQPSGAVVLQYNDRCDGIPTPGNPRPQVNITNPPNGSWVPSSGSVAVDTWDAVGQVPRVDYYVNGNYLATSTTYPFTLYYSGAPAGTYVVNAVAYDDAGDGYEISSPVTVHVY